MKEIAFVRIGDDNYYVIHGIVLAFTEDNCNALWGLVIEYDHSQEVS